MDILKTSIEWVRAESFSSAFFVIFGVLFLSASFGFCQWGKTDLARAYIIPTLVAGLLLVVLGAGLLIPNQARLTDFPEAYQNDMAGFISAELMRVEKTMGDYRIAVFLVFPIIIALCAVLFIFLSGPIWRTSLITTMAVLVVVILVDTNANARLEIYKTKLLAAEKQA